MEPISKKQLIRFPALQKVKLGGASRAFIYSMIKRGVLPAPLKMGRASFWDEAAVDAAISRLEPNGGEK